MKKIGIIFGAIFCIFAAYGVTETITWHVDNTTSTTTCESGGDIILPTAPTKYGYAFLGWRQGYTPIEYIAPNSNGTDINTGIYPNESTTFRIKFQITKPTGQLIGSYEGDTSKDYRLFNPDSQNIAFTSLPNRRISTSINFLDQTLDLIIGEYYIKDYTSNSLLTGTEASNPSSWTLSSDTIHIFGHRWDNTNNRVYLVQIWQNGTLIRDMIPVLDSNDVPCMYDRVSEQIFYNAGTGNFIAGPVISE